MLRRQALTISAIRLAFTRHAAVNQCSNKLCSGDKLLTAFHCVHAASSSEEILISRESLEGLPAASAAVGGMRRFFDISVPRNISSDVNQLEGEAHVYNVDDLKEVRA